MRRVTQFSLVLLAASGLCFMLPSCAHRAHFSDNGRPAIVTVEEFVQLSSATPAPHARGVRLAGRLIRAEATEKGWKALAEWLPFPTGPYAGPGGASPGEDLNFYLLFAGPIDEEGLEQGNELVMTGRVFAMEELTTLLGLRRPVPVLLAECLHVWKSAGTDLRDFQQMDPLDDRYPPPLEETYCADHQKAPS